MKAVTKILAGAAVVAAAAGGFAAPAAAQIFPGYGYGGGGGGIGQILDVILNAQRYGYGYQGYANDRSQIDQCAVAVEQRINRDYGYRYGSPYGASPYGGYGNYNPYGGQYGYNSQYNQGGAKVVGITRVERRSGTTTRVRGVATANVYANQYGQNNTPYGGQYGYNNNYGYNNYGYTNAGELSFKCDIDYRGFIKDIDIDRNDNAYYGYRRY